MIEVYECGTWVTTKIGNICAIITANCVRFEKVQYELSYFHNGERKEVWVDEREFSTDANKKPLIGFKK